MQAKSNVSIQAVKQRDKKESTEKRINKREKEEKASMKNTKEKSKQARTNEAQNEPSKYWQSGLCNKTCNKIYR